MKKVLVVSAMFIAASFTIASAGSYKQKDTSACPGECQKQIDELKSSQAQQDEVLINHGKTLNDHEARLTGLEQSALSPWYLRTGVALAWSTQKINNCGSDGCKPEWDSDLSLTGAIAAGREMGNFRTEVEFKYYSSNLEDHHADKYTLTGDVDISTIMLNGYYSIPVLDSFSLYAVAGIGYAHYSLSLESNVPAEIPSVLPPVDDSSNAFAYKVGTGVTYNFSSDWAIDVGYEYLGIADNDVSDSINGHNVVCSVIFKF